MNKTPIAAAALSALSFGAAAQGQVNVICSAQADYAKINSLPR